LSIQGRFHLFFLLFLRLRAENTAREATQRCNELKDKLMLQHTVQRLDLSKQHLVSGKTVSLFAQS
jgi:hypothetical protein